MAKKKSSFRGKVASNATAGKASGASYGHLMLPKGVSVYKESPGGKAKLDFLPYVVSDEKHPDRNAQTQTALVGDLWYKRPYRIHRGIGAGNDTVVCLTSVGKKCPICEYKMKLTKEGGSPDDIKALKSSLRNLYIVVPFGEKNVEEKPHIWDISQAMFQDLLTTELEEKPENEVFPDLEEGKTLRIRFDSNTIGNSKPFAEASRIDFDDRDEVYDEDILDKVPDLDKVLKVLTYKELEAKFLEIDSEDSKDEDDEDEEKPLRKKKVTKPEPEEDEDEDEDDEPAPPARKKKVTKPEPEEDDEDEDDEPAPPVKKKKAPAPVEDDDEDEDDEPAPPPTKKKKPAPVEDEDDDEPEPVKKKSSSGDKCPHGHRFGIDTEKYDECETCKLWDACDEAKSKRK